MPHDAVHSQTGNRWVRREIGQLSPWLGPLGKA